jgi:hypothetical protein
VQNLPSPAPPTLTSNLTMRSTQIALLYGLFVVGTIVIGAVEGAPIGDIFFFVALLLAIAAVVLPMVEVLARRQALLPALYMSLAGVSLVGLVIHDVIGLHRGWAVGLTLALLFFLAVSVRIRRAPAGLTIAGGDARPRDRA